MALINYGLETIVAALQLSQHLVSVLLIQDRIAGRHFVMLCDVGSLCTYAIEPNECKEHGSHERQLVKLDRLLNEGVFT